MYTKHIIIDFMYLYYKYKPTIDKGKMKRLTAIHKGNVVDISYVYYPLREIENIRKSEEKKCNNSITLSICFDTKSKRKELDENYKANRISTLTNDDISNIELIYEILKNAGYNIFKEEGLEADDIVEALVKYYYNKFDRTEIYTADADLLSLIDNKIIVNRYKQRVGYTQVSMNNFRQYCSEDFKCNMMYNTVNLYKSLCGDKSDNIPGIKGFGPAAYNKYMDYMGNKIEWGALGNYNYLKEVLLYSENYLGSDKLKQALMSYELIIPMNVDISSMEQLKISNREMRELAYTQYEMHTLI